mgnify:CR=1 FL=1
MLDLNYLFVLVPETFAAVDAGPADKPQDEDDRQDGADKTNSILVHVQSLSFKLLTHLRPSTASCLTVQAW